MVSAKVKTLVDSSIADNKVMIFSKSSCPYCTRAKNLFKSEFPNVQIKVIEIDSLDETSEIQDYLEKQTGQRTVPSIFINQDHVGGCSEVVDLNRKGKLEASLV